MKKAHITAEKKKFRCRVCLNVGFAFGYDLKRHMRTVHMGVEPMPEKKVEQPEMVLAEFSAMPGGVLLKIESIQGQKELRLFKDEK